MTKILYGAVDHVDGSYPSFVTANFEHLKIEFRGPYVRYTWVDDVLVKVEIVE